MDPGPAFGIGLATGSSWAQQRKFMMKSLGDLGLGKADIMKSIILEEADEVMKQYLKEKGKPMQMKVGKAYRLHFCMETFATRPNWCKSS